MNDTITTEEFATAPAPTFDMLDIIKAVEEWKRQKPTLLVRPEDAEAMAPLAQLVDIKTSAQLPKGSACLIKTAFLDDLVKAD